MEQTEINLKNQVKSLYKTNDTLNNKLSQMTNTQQKFNQEKIKLENALRFEKN